MKGLVRGWNVGCGRKASWQLWVDLRRRPHAVKLTAAADAVVGRKEDFDASLDFVFNGETVEVPTLKSSAYSYEKKSAACEDCVSFLREMSDRVRSKRFRERAYKVVDEMCERVFDDTKICVGTLFFFEVMFY